MNQIKQTTNYEMFTFRPDNRAKGTSDKHVKRLIKLIQIENKLPDYPMAVNEDMEIIDGQHRCRAAEQLGLPIYYEIKKGLKPQDMITMNCGRGWQTADFFNFYIKNGYIEYQKLDGFLKKHAMSLNVALSLFLDGADNKVATFKDGEFTFSEDIKDETIEYCFETVGKIRCFASQIWWLETRKFWKALFKLFLHPEFDVEVWRRNRDLKIDYFSARASYNDYLRMLENIYNFKQQKKLYLTDNMRDVNE